jgi:hypothetical protein
MPISKCNKEQHVDWQIRRLTCAGMSICQGVRSLSEVAGVTKYRPCVQLGEGNIYFRSQVIESITRLHTQIVREGGIVTGGRKFLVRRARCVPASASRNTI